VQCTAVVTTDNSALNGTYQLQQAVQCPVVSVTHALHAFITSTHQHLMLCFNLTDKTSNHLRLDHTTHEAPSTDRVFVPHPSLNSTSILVHTTHLPSFMSASPPTATLSCRDFADSAEQTYKHLPKYSQPRIWWYIVKDVSDVKLEFFSKSKLESKKID